MMRVSTNRSGFAVMELLLVVVVLGLISFVGYTFFTRQDDKKPANTTAITQSPTAKDVPAAPEVTSTDDLDEASAALDKSDTSSSADSAELDAQLQNF